MTTHSVECPNCEHQSTIIYRCEECGRDLANETTETQGMEARRDD